MSGYIFSRYFRYFIEMFSGQNVVCKHHNPSSMNITLTQKIRDDADLEFWVVPRPKHVNFDTLKLWDHLKYRSKIWRIMYFLVFHHKLRKFQPISDMVGCIPPMI